MHRPDQNILGAEVIGVLKRGVAIFSHSYPMTSYCRKYKDIISFSSSLLTKLKHKFGTGP